MRKRIWMIIAVFFVSGVVAFSVQSRDPCNTHHLYINDQAVSVFASPEEALSSMRDEPLLPDVNRLRLSCEGGRPEHDIQLYLRLAQENDEEIITSPCATFYNFSSAKSKASFAMNDIVSLDEGSNWDLVLFELITYEKTAAAVSAISQYAVFRWPDR